MTANRGHAHGRSCSCSWPPSPPSLCRSPPAWPPGRGRGIRPTASRACRHRLPELSNGSGSTWTNPVAKITPAANAFTRTKRLLSGVNSGNLLPATSEIETPTARSKEWRQRLRACTSGPPTDVGRRRRNHRRNHCRRKPQNRENEERKEEEPSGKLVQG
ncbi:unnamed protein product [Cuscuta campestris]|uniref:Uncharacterized protein n=1 Tax=Cuscuta campestris TaxID=132261 RepID=A0A484NHX9_9ASTE|nr:unnamed protein product [Cuscuta campestris]